MRLRQVHRQDRRLPGDLIGTHTQQDVELDKVFADDLVVAGSDPATAVRAFADVVTVVRAGRVVFQQP